VTRAVTPADALQTDCKAATTAEATSVTCDICEGQPDSVLCDDDRAQTGDVHGLSIGRPNIIDPPVTGVGCDPKQPFLFDRHTLDPAFQW
jgi:hypothetical protein